MLNKSKKIILTLLLIIFTSFNVFVFSANPAKAQVLVHDPSTFALEIQSRVEKTVGASIMQSLTLMLVQTVNGVVQSLARDAAVWVSSGGKGQKPLFDGRTLANYVRDSAITGVRDTVQDMFKTASGGYLSVDLCAPQLPSLLIKLQLGLLVGVSETIKPPDCTWNKLSDNWDTFSRSIESGAFLKQVGVMFEPNQSSLGVALEVNGRTIAAKKTAADQAAIDRLTNKGWKGVSSIVTGKIATPADVVRESFGNSYFTQPSLQQTASFSAFGNALASGGLQILGSAVATFSNTLLSKVTEKLTKGLFTLGDLLPDGSSGGNQLTTGAGFGAFTAGRRAAQQIFSDLIIPQTTQITDYDPLADFISCPNSANSIKNINNCVLDNAFANGIRLADRGAPITIAEAMDQGYLSNKPLISSTDNRNKQSDCYTKGYCYSNLVKLRRARIIPVGFELAAEVSNTIGGSYTLKDAVTNFNNCNEAGANDANHPFCHLIDPDWVLKLPATRCDVKGYGETLLSRDTSLRSEVCVDDQTCLSEDENGVCTGGYGYCTKEKNTWKISADTCDAQYNSCTTYNSRANEPVSYLKNTVEYDSCTAGNVGCRAYSTGKDLNNNWSLDIGKSIYFNKDLETCQAENAGCTALIPKAGLRQNFLPNSSFEDIGSTNNIIDWDQSSTIVVSSPQDSYEGSVAISPSPSPIFLNRDKLVKLNLNTTYTVSGYVKQIKPPLADAEIAIRLYTNPSQNNSVLDLGTAGILTDCFISDITDTLSVQVNTGPNNSGQFERISCSFLTPATQPLYAAVILSGLDFWFDAIQLEEGNVTDYLNTNAYVDAIPTYIKVAPEGVECPIGSTDPSCANYASVCKEEEVGCSSFAPTNGTPSVSGIASITDLCPQECVGYDSYKPDKALFDDPSSASILPFEYLIPDTAQTCNAVSVGCSEFTNLDTESKEYFNFIRQCEKPGTGQAVFYVWESFESGPQLRSYTLKNGTRQAGEVGNVPDYIAGFTNYSACTKQIFDLPITDPNYNPDCTEFINETGNSSYRLLSKTIIVTEECSQYRKTNSTQNDCQATGGTWNNTDQLCVYLGYKAESNSCSAQDNGCRAYSGGGSSNLKIIFQNDFESTTTEGWNAGINSTESLGRSGHSLRSPASIAGSSIIGKSVDGNISTNNTYLLSFWLKASTGGNQELILDTTNFIADIKPGSDIITPSGVWEKYEIGPITVTAVGVNPEIRLRLQGGSVFFIDNIVFEEVNDKLYLVEDSWNTPATCDQTIIGQFLPQAMLGCKEYTDQDNDTRHLKSFSSLCREESVGCKSFIDTYNSSSQSNEIYNLLCVLDDTNGGLCQYDGENVCEVEVGRSFCRFKTEDKNIFNAISGFKQSDYSSLDAFESILRGLAGSRGGIIIVKDESTIEVPADKQIYIVDDGSKTCQPIEAGCYEFGQGDLYTGNNQLEVYYKNMPDQYSQLLCGAEAQGCESWSNTDSIDYFKIPRTECVYQEASIGKLGGWFKKDNTSEPCYPAYVKNNTQELWFNADSSYNGSVGLCPQTQNGCTEFIDPQDLSGVHPDGKPYYLINNEKLQGLESECDGIVSKDEQCILFNNRTEINTGWSSLETYRESDTKKTAITPISRSQCLSVTLDNGKPVVSYQGSCQSNNDCTNQGGYIEGTVSYLSSTAPLFILSNDWIDPNTGQLIKYAIGGTGKCANDSNTILKVTKDRYCAEWLACKTYTEAKDPITGKTKPVCLDLGLCNQQVSLSDSDNTICSNFITNNVDQGKVLDAEYYSKRNTAWDGLEYSGYSLGNKYQIPDITAINVSDSSQPDMRLIANFNYFEGPNVALCFRNDNNLLGGCIDGDCTCTTDSDCEAGVARCVYGGKDLDGGVFNPKKAEAVTCRAYPEQSSPFPSYLGEFDANNILKGPKQSAQEFQNAFFCANGEQCECNYTKLTYGNNSIKKFITYGDVSTGEGICQGGPKDGLDCTPGLTYADSEGESCGKPELGGVCVKLNRQDDVLGWQGYCLERDYSTIKNANEEEAPCITWLPQDLVPGGVDIYNQVKTAGYVPPADGGRYYCLEAPGRKGDGFPFGLRVPENTLSTPDPYEYFLYTHDLSFPATLTGETGEQRIWSTLSYWSWSASFTPLSLLWGSNANTFDYKTFKSATVLPEDFLISAGTPYSSPVDTTIHKDEIDFINITFNQGGDYPSGTSFYITQKDTEPHLYLPGQICTSENRKLCSGEKGPGLTGLRKASSIIEGNKWYFLYSNGGSTSDFTSINLAKEDSTQARSICEQASNTSLHAMVLEFDFNDSGYFENVKIVNCNHSQTIGDGSVNITFKLREMCSVIADVASSKNKARTNIVWKYNPNNKEGLEVKPSITGNTIPYHYNYEISPFGSSASVIKPSKTMWYANWDQALYKDLIYGGVPWSAASTIDEAIGTPQRSDGNSNTIDFDKKASFVNIMQKDLLFATNNLANIFGKVYNVYSWSPVNNKYDEIDCNNSTSQACLDYAPEVNKKPAIYSFDPSIKLTNGQYSLVKANRFTINDNFNTPIVVNKKQFEARMRFYFWADTDYMPITGMNIDWGDDSTPVGTIGAKYKNNKPVCTDTDTEVAKVCSTDINIACDAGGTSMTCPFPGSCIVNSTTFGNSPGACEESYFDITHIYTCNDPECIFNPTVTITDNWGNQSVPATYDSTIILRP